jgi:hypothetical protein
LSYADSGNGSGVLTVSDGTNTVQLAVVGNYQAQDFSLASDGQGGTTLVNNVAGMTHFAAGEVIDVSQALNVAAGTEVVADGYLRVTTSGLVQVDPNGGGDNWVTLGNVGTSAGQYAISYLSGGVATTINVTPVAPPIGIDLNHDGVVSFVGTDAGVTFDYGYGNVGTAWVAPQDGILVRDANGDGKVTANEMVFSTGGSDLQGLAQYDTNGDGKLDAADADFNQFAVWQDSNSNGVVDAGEMKSLVALGITSISLSSDGIGYSAANGEVSVVGTGTITYANGTTGVLADATFATAGKPTDDQLRAAFAQPSNGAVLGAVAAAGLLSVPAHADVRLIENRETDAWIAHHQTLVAQPLALEPGQQNHALAGDTRLLADHHVIQPLTHSEPRHEWLARDHLSATDHGAAEQLSELLHETGGTNLPVMHPLAIPISVPMVSAEMLQAAMAGVAQHGAATLGGHSTTVETPAAQVTHALLDSLSGGADGKPDIDSLLHSIGAKSDIHEELSHALAMVGPHQGFAIPGTHGLPLVEALVLHAPPPPHG